MSALYGSVRASVAEHFNIPEDSIEPDTTLEDLGMDSLGLVELACVLQDELGLRVPEDEALRSTGSTFAEAVAAVERAQQPAVADAESPA
ncbi:acyl carrier protein [Streptomyces sp. B6B3]|uniref:acyl carrier protein n=1 Tax=Streptomyces sp. B6B3 TaxID=3153570 RepID=UPI00325D300D